MTAYIASRSMACFWSFSAAELAQLFLQLSRSCPDSVLQKIDRLEECASGSALVVRGHADERDRRLEAFVQWSESENLTRPKAVFLFSTDAEADEALWPYYDDLLSPDDLLPLEEYLAAPARTDAARLMEDLPGGPIALLPTYIEDWGLRQLQTVAAALPVAIRLPVQQRLRENIEFRLAFIEALENRRYEREAWRALTQANLQPASNPVHERLLARLRQQITVLFNKVELSRQAPAVAPVVRYFESIFPDEIGVASQAIEAEQTKSGASIADTSSDSAHSFKNPDAGDLKIKVRPDGVLIFKVHNDEGKTLCDFAVDWRQVALTGEALQGNATTHTGEVLIPLNEFQDDTLQLESIMVRALEGN